jgi:hypothetical protein
MTRGEAMLKMYLNVAAPARLCSPQGAVLGKNDGIPEHPITFNGTNDHKSVCQDMAPKGPCKVQEYA